MANGTTPSTIEVRWSFPENLQSFYNTSDLIYWIDYSKGRNHTKTEVGRQKFKYTITDLKPYSELVITVWGIPVDGLYDGEKNTTIARSAEDVPGGPPIVYPGAFRLHNTKVDIFWQNVEEKFANGKILSFNVTVDSKPSTPMSKEVGPDDHMVSFLLGDWSSINVTVVAINSKGTSPGGHMVIGKTFKNKTRKPMAQKNGSHVSLSWEKPIRVEDLTSYTLIECTTELCQGDVTFNIIDSNETGYVKRYVRSAMYGLAANTYDSSSGIDQEWICVYQFNGSIPEVDFNLSRVAHDEIKVTLKQHTNCSQTPNFGFTSNYTVQWRSSECPELSDCPDGGIATTVFPDNEYIIRDVQKHAYTVIVYGVGQSGPGPPTEHTLHFSGETSFHLQIFGAVVGAVCLIIVAIFLIKKIVRYIESNIPQPISPPGVSHEIEPLNRTNYDAYTSKGWNIMGKANGVKERELPPSPHNGWIPKRTGNEATGKKLTAAQDQLPDLLTSSPMNHLPDMEEAMPSAEYDPIEANDSFENKQHTESNNGRADKPKTLDLEIAEREESLKVYNSGNRIASAAYSPAESQLTTPDGSSTEGGEMSSGSIGYKPADFKLSSDDGCAKLDDGESDGYKSAELVFP